MLLLTDNDEYKVYNINGLNIFVISSKADGNIKVYINYPRYHFMMFYCGYNYEDFDISDIEFIMEQDFAYIMKNYFTQIEKLEENYE